MGSLSEKPTFPRGVRKLVVPRQEAPQEGRGGEGEGEGRAGHHHPHPVVSGRRGGGEDGLTC